MSLLGPDIEPDGSARPHSRVTLDPPGQASMPLVDVERDDQIGGLCPRDDRPQVSVAKVDVHGSVLRGGEGLPHCAHVVEGDGLPQGDGGHGAAVVRHFVSHVIQKEGGNSVTASQVENRCSETRRSIVSTSSLTVRAI